MKSGVTGGVASEETKDDVIVQGESNRKETDSEVKGMSGIVVESGVGGRRGEEEQEEEE